MMDQLTTAIRSRPIRTILAGFVGNEVATTGRGPSWFDQQSAIVRCRVPSISHMVYAWPDLFPPMALNEVMRYGLVDESNLSHASTQIYTDDFIYLLSDR